MNNQIIEQVPFQCIKFAENPEPRCPCVLLLDTSGSMMGKPIAELNAGLSNFKDQLISDNLASKRVEIAIITFGPVKIINNFQLASEFYPPVLSAEGDTPIGDAIKQGLMLLQQRKEVYKTNGIAYYRPWVFLITDGSPTDYWQDSAVIVKEGEVNQSFAFFSVGVENADMKILSQISTRDPLKLRGLNFNSLFQWLSSSMRSVSRSSVDNKVLLDNPVAPSGWACV